MHAAVLLILLIAPSRAGESIRLSAPSSLFGDALKPCVLRRGAAWQEPGTLDALLACQSKLRLGWIARYRREKGGEPPASALDKLDDYQRAEARDYAARHPDRAATSSPEEAPRPQAPSPGSSAGAATAAQGPAASRGRCAPRARRPAAATGAFAEQQKRTAAAMRANARVVDPAVAADLEALNGTLAADSKNGTAGITGDSARAIAEYLDCEQGSVSPDMQTLLDHLSRDGGTLSDRSMRELKQAARAAKGAGLDLGVDGKLEEWLLDPTTDPGPRQPGAL